MYAYGAEPPIGASSGKGEFMRNILIAIVAAGLANSHAAAQPAGERLARPALAGFVTGYDANANGSAMLEQIPVGETVERWTRMVTTQRFARLAGKTDARTFLLELGASVSRACPGARTSPVQMRGAAAELRADCPLNPSTGKPETFLAKAMMGATDLHVAQVAFRRVPTNADLQWARDYLAGVALCRAGDVQAACTRK